MAKFPSEEWVKVYMEQLNANEKYEEAAKTWEGDFLFVIQSDAELKEPSTMYMDLWHGKCRGVALVKPGEDKKAAFVYSGPYGNWKKLINKQIDPIQGLLTESSSSKETWPRFCAQSGLQRNWLRLRARFPRSSCDLQAS